MSQEATIDTSSPDVTSPTAYDEVPYPAAVFPQTHPDRLAMLARLFGRQAASPEQCRVLELGCAHGSNLIPMAYSLPRSEFIGVDLSRVQVSHGQKIIRDLRLTNVELRQANILDLPAMKKELGTFDFIITHGIYSWVPEPVREAILEASKVLLNPNGVAFLSHNAYPGWKFRGMLRDMMLYHTRNFPDPKFKVAQARELVTWLTNSTSEDDPYGAFLRVEIKHMAKWPDEYFLHDSLEEINQPFYFHEVASAAARHGLQYLGDTEVHMMFPTNLPEYARRGIAQVGVDTIATEQYMDFLRNRMFRQTLFVHDDVPIDRLLTPERVYDLYVSANVQPARLPLDVTHSAPIEFVGKNDRRVSVTDRIVKSALSVLGEIWPRALPFAELASRSIQRIESAIGKAFSGDEKSALTQKLAENLLVSLSLDFAMFHATPGTFVTTVSEKPVASVLARYMAAVGSKVPTLKHDQIELDVFGLRLISLLDGTRTLTDIGTAVTEDLQAGRLVAQQNGVQLTDTVGFDSILRNDIENRVRFFAETGLLEG